MLGELWEGGVVLVGMWFLKSFLCFFCLRHSILCCNVFCVCGLLADWAGRVSGEGKVLSCSDVAVVIGAKWCSAMSLHWQTGQSGECCAVLGKDTFPGRCQFSTACSPLKWPLPTNTFPKKSFLSYMHASTRAHTLMHAHPHVHSSCTKLMRLLVFS